MEAPRGRGLAPSLGAWKSAARPSLRARKSAHSLGVAISLGAIAFAIAAGTVTAPAYAQSRAKNESVATDPRLARAQRYLRDGRANEALSLFQALEKQYPGDWIVLLGLAQSAIAAGSLDDARRVIGQESVKDPTNPDWIRMRGALAKAEGKPKEAIAAWRGLLTAIPDREEAYRVTARLIANEKMLPEAIAILEEGRVALGDSLLFGPELAGLRDLTGAPEQAILEHARAVAAGRESAAEAAAHSAELSLSSEAAGRAAAQSTSLPTATPELRAELCDFTAALWLMAGNCAAARAAAAEAGVAVGDCGERELLFAERSAEGACAGEAVGALRSAIAKCPTSPTAWRARRSLSERLVAEGSYVEARDLLKELVATSSPEGCDRSAALLALGGVLLDGVRDPAGARMAFQDHVATGGRCIERTAWQARLGAAQAALLAGDAAAAEKGFLEAIERGADDATREAGLFRLGELYFYTGDFVKAAENYRKLLQTFPAGIYVNDAVARIVFLDQGDAAGEGLLKEFADAQRSGLAGDAAGASARFQAIMRDFPLSELRDDAALEAALLAKWRRDYAGAVATLDAIVKDFPESPLAPRALIEKGAIRAEQLADLAGARTDYERVLVDYPTSLLADEARTAIEQIDARLRERTRG
jgi:tetratricopeptide (TPR) repeat protein